MNIDVCMYACEDLKLDLDEQRQREADHVASLDGLGLDNIKQVKKS